MPSKAAKSCGPVSAAPASPAAAPGYLELALSEPLVSPEANLAARDFISSAWASSNWRAAIAATARSWPEGSAGSQGCPVDLPHFLNGRLRVSGNGGHINGNLSRHRIGGPVGATLIGIDWSARVLATHPGMGLLMGSDLSVASRQLPKLLQFLLIQTTKGTALAFILFLLPRIGLTNGGQGIFPFLDHFGLIAYPIRTGCGRLGFFSSGRLLPGNGRFGGVDQRIGGGMTGLIQGGGLLNRRKGWRIGVRCRRRRLGPGERRHRIGKYSGMANLHTHLLYTPTFSTT